MSLHINQPDYNLYKQINIYLILIKMVFVVKNCCLLRDFSINLTKRVHRADGFVSMRSSKQFECMFIGADIIFDNNLNPHIIEFNSDPIKSWNINATIKTIFKNFS